MASAWLCPHCEHAAVITDQHNVRGGNTIVDLGASDGVMGIRSTFIVCPNPRCRRTSLSVIYGHAQVLPPPGQMRFLGTPRFQQLVPNPAARQLDPEVPEPIRQDYEEASLILQSSPKAAATLARRALQGMIRDFHKIQKPTLKHEVDAIKPLVDPAVWDAIDAVRRVGNIGAHMEKDINIIVDVEPAEADKLLALVELLAREWYVARRARAQALEAIVKIGKDKDAQRSQDGADTANPDAAEPMPPDATA